MSNIDELSSDVLQKENVFASNFIDEVSISTQIDIISEHYDKSDREIVQRNINEVYDSINDCEYHEEMGFVVNMEVNVMSRTWPGINKPGGAGKIISFRYDEGQGSNVYVIKYPVEGCTDKDVPEKYIKARTVKAVVGSRLVKGRCKWCPSFFKDCGCDQSIDPSTVVPKEPAIDRKGSVRRERESSRHEFFVSLTQTCLSPPDDDLDSPVNREEEEASENDSESNYEGEHSDYEEEADLCVNRDDEDEEEEQLEEEDLLSAHLCPKTKRRKVEQKNTGAAAAELTSQSSSQTRIESSASHVTVPTAPVAAVLQSDSKGLARQILDRIKDSASREATGFTDQTDSFLQLESAESSLPRDSYAHSKSRLSGMNAQTCLELLGLLPDHLREYIKRTKAITAQIVAMHRTLDDEDFSTKNEGDVELRANRLLNLRDNQLSLLLVMTRAGVDIANMTMTRAFSLRKKDSELKRRVKHFELQLDALEQECGAVDTVSKTAMRKLETLFDDRSRRPLEWYADEREEREESSGEEERESDGSTLDYNVGTEFTRRDSSSSSGRQRGASGAAGARDDTGAISRRTASVSSTTSGEKRSRVVRDTYGNSGDAFGTGTGSRQSHSSGGTKNNNSSRDGAQSDNKRTKTDSSSHNASSRGPNHEEESDSEHQVVVRRARSRNAHDGERVTGSSVKRGQTPTQSRRIVHRHTDASFERQSIRSRATTSSAKGDKLSRRNSASGGRAYPLLSSAAGDDPIYDTDREMEDLFGQGAQGAVGTGGLLRRNGTAVAAPSAATIKRAKLTRRMFRSVDSNRGGGGGGGADGRRNPYESLLTNDDRDTFGDLRGPRSIALVEEAEEGRAQFYRQVRWQTTSHGTGRVIVWEGARSSLLNGVVAGSDVDDSQHRRNIAAYLATGQHVSEYHRVEPLAAANTITAGVSAVEGDISSRLANLNLTSRSIAEPSGRYVDRVLSELTTNGLQAVREDYAWLSDERDASRGRFVGTARGGEESEDVDGLAERAMRSGGVLNASELTRSDGMVPSAALTASKTWASELLIDLWSEQSSVSDNSLRSGAVLTALLDEVAAPCVHETRHLLAECDALQRSERREEITASLEMLVLSKSMRLSALWSETLLNTHYFTTNSLPAVSFVKEYFKTARQFERLLLSCSATTSSGQTFQTEKASTKSRQSQVRTRAWDGEEEDDEDEEVPLEAFARLLSGEGQRGRDKLSSFMLASRDSAADDLWVRLVACHLIGKVLAVRAFIDSVVQRAEGRMRRETGLSAEEMTQEQQDKQLILMCHEELVSVLTDVVETLLLNRRLLLAILCFVSETSGTGELNSCFQTQSDEGHVSGVEGRAVLFIRLLFVSLNTLDGLRNARYSFKNEEVWSATVNAEPVDCFSAYKHWDTLNVIVEATCGLTGLNSRSAHSSAAMHVNPSVEVVRDRGEASDSTAHLWDSSAVGTEAIWGVISLYTVVLRKVGLRKAFTASQLAVTTRIETSNWPMVKTLCMTAASEVTLSSPSSILNALHRTASLASVWQSPIRSLDFFITSVRHSMPAFRSLPVYVDSGRSTDTTEQLLADQTRRAQGGAARMDDKTAVLLCCQSFLGASTTSAPPSESIYHRLKLHEQLLLTVSLLFGAYGLVNPYGDYFSQSSGKGALSVEAERSLDSIDKLRSAFQDFLCSLVTHSTVNTAAGHRHVVTSDADQTSAALNNLKRLLGNSGRFEGLFTIFTDRPTFAAGLVLCLIAKELTAVCGLEFMTQPVEGCGSESYRNKLIWWVCQNLNYEDITADMYSPQTSDQRVCLMWFASLVTFNPLPITASRQRGAAESEGEEETLSSRLEMLLVDQTADMNSLGPVTTLIEHFLLPVTNQPADQIRTVTLTSVSTLCGILRHLMDATSNSLSVTEGEGFVQVFVGVLPQDLIKVSLNYVKGIVVPLQQQAARDANTVTRVYLFGLVVKYLTQWQERTLSTVRYCAFRLKGVCSVDERGVFQRLLITANAQVLGFDNFMLNVLQVLETARVVCRQLSLQVNDCVDSFALYPPSLASMGDDFGRFLETAKARSSGAMGRAASVETVCFVTTKTMADILNVLQHRHSLRTALGITSPDSVALSPVAFHHSTVSFLGQLGPLDAQRAHESNLQNYLKSLYWEALLAGCHRDDHLLAANTWLPLVAPYLVDIYLLVVVCSLLHALRPVTCQQAGFQGLFQSVLRLSEEVVLGDKRLSHIISLSPVNGANNVKSKIPLAAPSQLLRLSSAFLTAHTELTATGSTPSSSSSYSYSSSDSNMWYADWATGFLRVVSSPCDYAKFEAAKKHCSVIFLRSLIAKEEVPTSNELVTVVFRLLRHLCTFRSGDPETLFTLSTRIKQSIAHATINSSNRATSSVKSAVPVNSTYGQLAPQYSAPVATVTRRMLLSPDQVGLFLSEFALDDVRSLLEEVIEGNQTGDIQRGIAGPSEASQQIVHSMFLYSQMVSCMAYSDKSDWHVLLQLLMVLTSANVSQVSSTDEYALLAEETLFVWALGLCLTPDKTAGLATKYRGDDETLRRAFSGELRVYVGMTEGVLSRCVDHFMSMVGDRAQSNAPLSDDEASAATTRVNLLQTYLFMDSDLRWSKMVDKVRDVLPLLAETHASKIELLLRGADWRATRERLRVVVEGLVMVLAFVV